MIEPGKRVGLFVTCLVDFFRPSVGFAAVKLLEQRQTLLVVTGIAAQGGERIWREGDEIGDRQPPRHIFDIRVKAAIFVDDEDRG